MHAVIVSDAWHPQVNGVVRSLEATAEKMREWGHRVTLITPDAFRSIPMPTYPDIRLALFPGKRVAAKLTALSPEAVHIATEGPLGWAARRWCLRQRFPFTTSYHTQFPEYVRLRAPVPLWLTYGLLRWFHAPAEATLVPTPTQRKRLLDHGFRNVRLWSRGVDTRRFRPLQDGERPAEMRLPGPVSVYLGRVAVEKNIEAFLDISLPGTKVVIGDGPDLAKLKASHPAVKFLGFRRGDELARLLAAADVFVFPSRTDTFGLVLLEAMACGVPVAAYPVTGPIDVVDDSCGVLDEDLRDAIIAALNLEQSACRKHALRYSWDTATEQFLQGLRPHEGIDKPILGDHRPLA